ncbi:DUF2752 domain-containing protein [Subsaxibacter sp. CAU 1640]|uniref:DUF2752 domain-containing protein n=1 Tax=Subsaxibacter sp. CAU 1640 TaxID=2933271 RepID=UPI0020068A02|nr:DUF2752 domain-containing protein [Subsaxibacter sp. CAU 1640]MCK7590449.1 DUF2752 domain-containing protein [Subsaxibacter sp. CAU 1640]
MSSPEDFMLPCLNKKLLGVECFGCGIQRATVLLFQGEFTAAFLMYPAIYSLFLLALFLIFNLFVKFKFDERIKIALVVLNVSIIVISYLIKVIN